jgi:DeoR family transcriptional regulator of aga operon
VEEAALKRRMLQSSSKSILLADSTKFSRTFIAKVCALKEVDCIITEEPPHEDMLRELEHNNVRLVVAK